MNIRNCQQFLYMEECFVIVELNYECTEHIFDPFCKIVCKTYLTLYDSSNEKLLCNLPLSSLLSVIK